MIQIVWEFVVKPEALPTFEAVYGPEGDWVRLFAAHPGYRGTSLLRDSTRAERFLTIDRWDSLEDFTSMKVAAAADYSALDTRFAGLMVSERPLGTFLASGERG